MEVQTKMKVGFLFRWVIFFSIILYLLFFMITIHVLIEKISKYFCHETEENISNEENENVMDYLVDGYYFLTVTFVVFSVCAIHYSPYEMLPIRYTQLFQNFSPILSDPIRMFLFYYKNPHLRQYLLRHIFRTPSVQPQNSVELELNIISD